MLAFYWSHSTRAVSTRIPPNLHHIVCYLIMIIKEIILNSWGQVWTPQWLIQKESVTNSIHSAHFQHFKFCHGLKVGTAKHRIDTLVKSWASTSLHCYFLGQLTPFPVVAIIESKETASESGKIVLNYQLESKLWNNI